MKKILFSVISFFMGIISAYAVVAYPHPVKVNQPDGTTLTIRLHGDEFLHWTTCGNSLVARGADGYWHYASFDAQGASSAVGGRVKSDLPGDGLGIKPPSSAVAKALEKRNSMARYAERSSGGAAPSASSSISIGDKHFLILLIEFKDKSFTRTKQDFVDMLSGASYTYNGAQGSVNKYYNDVSFEKFSPQFDVYGPIKVSYTSAQCATNYEANAVMEACRYADTELGVDFSKYCNREPGLVDNVFFFFPGYNQAEGGGDDTIWPHAVTYYSPFLTLDGVGIYKYGCTSEWRGSSGKTAAGIGTFCHEFGHILGLPDFYDTDYDTNGQGSALDYLSLMSSGNYNNEGRTPPYFTYEEKHILGWDNGLILLRDGQNTLEKTSTNTSYYSTTPTEGEYYLYESRPTQGWDKYSTTDSNPGGLAIYHVDKSGNILPDGSTAASRWAANREINIFASHQCMDLVESAYPESSLRYYSDYVFPGNNKLTSFGPDTTPSNRAWSGSETGYNLTNIRFDSSSGRTTLTVQTDKGLEGRVTDVQGQSISGAKITIKYVSSANTQALTSSAGPDGLRKMSYSPVANAAETVLTSDADGYFSTELSQAGVFSVTAVKEGYVVYSANVTVNTLTFIDIVLTTPADEATEELRKYSTLAGYSVGYGEGSDWYAALRYTASELKQYEGSSIKQISFMANNGGTGTVSKMGVQVYFDNTLQCDCECPVYVFNTLNTVDISAQNLKIPSGKSVTFVYYVLDSTFGYPGVAADDGAPVEGANLYSSKGGPDFYAYEEGNFVISAVIINGSQVIDLAGFNVIPQKSSYRVGDKFYLELGKSSANPPSSVTWTVNGQPKTGSITLSMGTYIIRASLTYPSGRKETIESVINVE